MMMFRIFQNTNIMRTHAKVLCFKCLRYSSHQTRLHVNSPGSWSLFGIKEYGSLHIDCPTISTVIKPIDAIKHHFGDKAFVQLTSASDSLSDSELSHLVKDLEVHYNEETSLLHVHCANKHLLEELKLIVEVPHFYDVEAKVKSLHISSLQSDDCLIRCYDGACDIVKLKARKINVEATGDVDVKGYLHGNGRLYGDRDIQTGKLQGLDFTLIAPNGNIRVSSVYAKSIECESKHGNINIENMTCNGKVTTKDGDISVLSISGSLEACTENGKIDISVERCGTLSVESNAGDIDIGISDGVSAFFEGQGSSIDVPEDLILDGCKLHNSSGGQSFEGKIGGGTNAISAKTNLGDIRLNRKSWASQFSFNFE